jgi:CRP-like cAMP-binding protein
MDYRESIHSDIHDLADHHAPGYAPSRARSLRKRQRTDEGARSSNLILAKLPADVYRRIEPGLKTVSLSKEQFLYQEEDRLNYIYFPETAVVSEFKILEDGRMVEIAVTGREGAIGLPSLMSDAHVASNCAQVSQAGLAKRIDVETFEKIINSDTELRAVMSHFLDQYIRQISQKAICNMYHSVKERLCTWLLMVQDRCGRTTLNLTHEQVARILGVYRPSITCIAQELRENKLINYSRGGISIVDRRRVEDAACHCYSELGWNASV